MTYKSQTLSAVVITHNNAATLERALSSLKWVDDLIVFDRGSTDGTVAIARGFTNRVYYHPSPYLNIIRRDAFSSAKGDWLLWVEPDEWLEEMLRHEIDGVLLNTPSNLNGFAVPCQFKFQGRTFSKGFWCNQKRQLRLFRKGQWQIEDNWSLTLSVNGDVANLDRPIGCEPFINLDRLFSAVNHFSTLAAYEHFEQQGLDSWPKKACALLWHAKLTMWRSLILEGKILQGAAGISLATAQSVATFLKYAKIRSLRAKA